MVQRLLQLLEIKVWQVYIFRIYLDNQMLVANRRPDKAIIQLFTQLFTYSLIHSFLSIGHVNSIVKESIDSFWLIKVWRSLILLLEYLLELNTWEIIII